MVEEQLQIKTPDGMSDSFLLRPGSDEPLPGVLFLTDIAGMRPAQDGMARRIASQGYVVLVPNLFYRTAKPPVVGLPVNWADLGGRMRELSSPLTPDAATKDLNAYIDALASNRSVSGASIAVIGFCYSGSLAMRIAAARPDRVGLVVSFHGGRLYTDDPSSPHLLLPKIRARLYFGHAEGDRSMPQDAIDNFNAALEMWGGAYESEIYSSAGHGWTVPDSPAYNEPQAERAYSKLKQLLSSNR